MLSELELKAYSLEWGNPCFRHTMHKYPTIVIKGRPIYYPEVKLLTAKTNVL